MKAITVIVLAMALSMLCLTFAPALALKPTVVPCSFTMVALQNLEPGESWWTGDGTIFHIRGRTASVGILTSPTLMVGMAVGVTDMDFNTKTGEGNAIRTYSIEFFEPVIFTRNPPYAPTGVPNPFGIGTLEGKAVLKVTSLYNNLNAGDFTGLLVATHGTGDFENAKLVADLEGHPFTIPGTTTTTIKISLSGELTFHK